MKKYLFILFFGMNCFAGSPTCTDVTNVTTGNSYTALDSDCIIRVNRPFSFTDFQVFLPETGNTFTVENSADYNTDHCENYGDEEEPLYLCQPRAITVYSADFEHNTVFGQESLTDAGYYIQESPHRSSNVFTYDNVSNWDVTFN